MKNHYHGPRKTMRTLAQLRIIVAYCVLWWQVQLDRAGVCYFNKVRV